MRPDETGEAGLTVFHLGCVIMASGEGKRFGGNKLMAELAGKPLLSWVLEATDGIFARRVVVTRHEDVEKLCQNKQVPVLRHDLPYRNDTVRLGLEAVGQDVDGCLFCAGDQPLLRRETLLALALAANRDRDAIWRLAYDEVPGAPVLFPRWAFDQLRRLPQGRGGNVIVQEYPERVRLLSARDSWELMDVDTPDDLQALKTFVARQ